MFFSWLMACSIFLVGIVVQIVECYTEQADGGYRCPQFEPVGMLGGAVWATGNLMVVPIVKSIGLGLGLCTWGSVNMFAGWATGKFGLFGLKADAISSPGLNYAGVFMTTIAIILFMFIKPSLGKGAGKSKSEGMDDADAELLAGEEGGEEEGKEAEDGDEANWVDRMPEANKRAFGIAASVASGLCYGACPCAPRQVWVGRALHRPPGGTLCVGDSQLPARNAAPPPGFQTLSWTDPSSKHPQSPLQPPTRGPASLPAVCPTSGAHTHHTPPSLLSPAQDSTSRRLHTSRSTRTPSLAPPATLWTTSSATSRASSPPRRSTSLPTARSRRTIQSCIETSSW